MNILGIIKLPIRVIFAFAVAIISMVLHSTHRSLRVVVGAAKTVAGEVSEFGRDGTEVISDLHADLTSAVRGIK